MQMYASQAGKSGGEYYTPQEVSELLARITVRRQDRGQQGLRPGRGSGSLLLKFAKVLGKDNVRQGFFGQEINLTTYNLARINMFLHDVNFEQFDIAHGDTLIDPAHWDDEPFEAIVSNPPYSIKWEGDANPLLINDPRYAPAGVLAPKSKADLAFTMHMLHVAGRRRHRCDRRVPRRALPRRCRAEDPQVPHRQQLRRRRHPAPAGSLLRHDHRDLHHRAQEVEGRQRVLFIDASAEFVRQGNKNKLTDATSSHGLDAFVCRARGRRPPRCPAVDQLATCGERLQPVGVVVRRGRGHERGGRHRGLNAEIARIVARQSELRAKIDAIVADLDGSNA
jgi:type I restriction enzyme M protein